MVVCTEKGVAGEGITLNMLRELIGCTSMEATHL